MKIYIGGDHGGYELKAQLQLWLEQLGHQVEECGAFVFDPEDDYPQFAFAVAEKVAADPAARGILFCRSSGGVTIAANKVRGARAVSAQTTHQVQHVVSHDHANILSLAGDWLSLEEMQNLVQTFLDTEFSDEERHVRRVRAIQAYEQAAGPSALK